MDIEQCMNCKRIFISEGSNYCENCGDFAKLVEEKVEMLLSSINRKDDNG